MEPSLFSTTRSTARSATLVGARLWPRGYQRFRDFPRRRKTPQGENCIQPRAPILIADRLYREIWGPQQPDGSYVRLGRLPRARSEEAIEWYKLAFERDDRPEVRDRAQVSAVSLIMVLQNQTRRKSAP